MTEEPRLEFERRLEAFVGALPRAFQPKTTRTPQGTLVSFPPRGRLPFDLSYNDTACLVMYNGRLVEDVSLRDGGARVFRIAEAIRDGRVRTVVHGPFRGMTHYIDLGDEVIEIANPQWVHWNFSGGRGEHRHAAWREEP